MDFQNSFTDDSSVNEQESEISIQIQDWKSPKKENK